MRTRATLAACFVAGLALAASPVPAAESGPEPAMGGLLIPLVLAAPEGGDDTAFTGWVLIGLQGISGENTDSSKFLEYRDIPEGVVLPELVLRYDGADRRNYLDLEGEDVGQLDQRIVLRSGKLDRWNLDFLWDRIPHSLSSESELIYDQLADNEFRLPADIHSALRSARGDQAAVDAVFDTLREPYPLRFRRDTYRIDYGWKPHPQWKVRAAAERQEEKGRQRRTAQITYMDVNEFPEAVDQRTDTFRLGTEWANARAFASADVELSRFRQGPDAMVWEQPFEEIDPRRSWQGAIGLPPDNDAWSGTVAGGVNFGKTQRLVGTLSYAQWEQDEAFLPATINQDLQAGDPPRDSLDGRIDRTLLDLRYTARPLRRLGLKAWYRSYDLDNATDYLMWEDVVMTDDFEEGITRGTLPVGYRKSNAGVDFDVKLANRLNLGLGYEREEWRRDYRETRKTTEDIGVVRLDWVPGPAVNLRLKGELGRRRYDDYDHVRVLQYAYPDEDPDDLEGAVSPDQRKYTQANRDRHEVDFLVHWTPVTPFTLGVGINYGEYDYSDSVLGLGTERNNGYTLDLVWAPTARLRFYGNWALQAYTWDTRQRYRRNSNTDDPLDDWSSHNEDRTVTWGLGMKANLVADRLAWTLDWVRNDGRGQLDNEWVPGGNANGDDLEDFPEFRNELSRLDTEFTVLLNRGWEMRAGYIYEEYTAERFKLDPMQLYMEDFDSSGGSGSSNYMAALVPDYRANIFSLLVGYRW